MRGLPGHVPSPAGRHATRRRPAPPQASENVLVFAMNPAALTMPFLMPGSKSLAPRAFARQRHRFHVTVFFGEVVGNGISSSASPPACKARSLRERELDVSMNHEDAARCDHGAGVQSGPRPQSNKFPFSGSSLRFSLGHWLCPFLFQGRQFRQKASRRGWGWLRVPGREHQRHHRSRQFDHERKLVVIREPAMLSSFCSTACQGIARNQDAHSIAIGQFCNNDM